MQQTRKIKPSYRSVTGYLSYSEKSIPYESTLERDFLLYYTLREDVLDIVAQPIQIPFMKNNRTYFYTPDFFISFTKNSGCKPIIVEVKPKTEWVQNWHDWKEKWKAMLHYCKNNGYVFHIYDESRIRHDALANINFLMRYKNLQYDIEDVNAIINQVNLMENTTIDYLLTRFFQGTLYRQHGFRIICHLLLNKKLFCDLFTEINEQTIVWKEKPCM